MQDEITAQIMNAVRVTIDQSETRASRKLHPQSLQVWQLRAQAADHFHRWNRNDMHQAIELSRRAIALAPDDAIGHAYLAGGLWANGTYFGLSAIANARKPMMARGPARRE